MSRKKKTYAALLVVTFAALVVDRLLTSEPAEVSAADRPTTTPVAGTATEPAAGQGGGVAAASFPQHLPELLEGPPPRDAFAPTPAVHRAMRGPIADQEAGAGPGQSRPRAMSAIKFKGRHNLVAVMQGPSLGVAVVDGQWLEVGEVLDECVLVEITGRSAVFECGDGKAELTLKTTGQADPR